MAESDLKIIQISIIWTEVVLFGRRSEQKKRKGNEEKLGREFLAFVGLIHPIHNNVISVLFFFLHITQTGWYGTAKMVF